MSMVCGQLPSRINFSLFRGDISAYYDALYKIFRRDFIENEVTYLGKRVDIIHEKYFSGRERSFWHLISEGGRDEERMVYNVRSSYLPYARALIMDTVIDCRDYKTWIKYHDQSKRNRHYIWCQRENYLVILEERKVGFKLITAYPVEEYMVKKYEKEYNKTKTPITRMDEISTPSTLG
ncbi:MAG: hypothetical protein IJK77_07875 [Lachnospiraceae bacterium]|nr:hypothetical protein [Lachnospiraceae bacterium]